MIPGDLCFCNSNPDAVDDCSQATQAEVLAPRNAPTITGQ